MTQIITAAEEEADSCASDPAPRPVEPTAYSWWNVLLGRHDQELFERYAFWGDGHSHSYSHSHSGSHSGSHDESSGSGKDVKDDVVRDSTASSGKESGETKESSQKSTAVLGKESEMPRYWVLTDHGRKQIVLVFRGMQNRPSSYLRSLD